MKKLTEREDQIMQIIWATEGIFIRDILAELPKPTPHYNTIATLVKILVKKGFLGSKKFGNTDRYFAIIPLEAYRKEHIMEIKKKYFGNSLANMMAHFAKQEKLSDKEIDELITIIKSKKA
ncbi:MAG: BlaI/MecI/CopY family transcriptional regulator [Bacteroidota bacterium]